MPLKHLTVSLVIPAYNEERHLGRCLETIAAQTETADEVIVVDNNCTDKTVEVARQFPFVRVVRQPRQGLAHSRDAGFDAATSDIIARIDGDTLVSPDWIAQIRRTFTEAPHTNAITGSIYCYDLMLRRFVSIIDLHFRRYLADRLEDEMYLFGGNMAIRRSVWQQVRDELCRHRHLHEDLDLAMHLAERQIGGIELVEALRVGISGRRFDTSYASFFEYIMASPRTYMFHGSRHYRHMYYLIAFLMLIHGPARLLYRLTDPATGKFSIKKIWHLTDPREQRISPISNNL